MSEKIDKIDNLINRNWLKNQLLASTREREKSSTSDSEKHRLKVIRLVILVLLSEEGTDYIQDSDIKLHMFGEWLNTLVDFPYTDTYIWKRIRQFSDNLSNARRYMDGVLETIRQVNKTLKICKVLKPDIYNKYRLVIDGMFELSMKDIKGIKVGFIESSLIPVLGLGSSPRTIEVRCDNLSIGVYPIDDLGNMTHDIEAFCLYEQQ